MLNGRKNAVIGLSAILALALAELAAIVTAIALFFSFVFGLDLPLFSTED